MTRSLVYLGLVVLLGAACDDRHIRAEHRALFASLPEVATIAECPDLANALERRPELFGLVSDASRFRQRFDVPLSAELATRLSRLSLDGLAADFACVARDPKRRPRLMQALGTAASLFFDRADLEAAHDADRAWAWALAGLQIYAPLDPTAYVDYFNTGYFFSRITRMAAAHPPSDARRREIMRAIDDARMSRSFLCAGFEEEYVGTGGVAFAGRLARADREAMKKRWGADPLFDDEDYLSRAKPSLAAWRARREFFDPLVAACRAGGELAPALAASQAALDRLRALDGSLGTMAEIARDRLKIFGVLDERAATARRALGGS